MSQLANFQTESDKLAELQTQANNLINQESMAEITTAEQNNKAADLGRLLRDYRKKIEDDRTSIVKPINDSVKLINAKYKPVTEAIDKAIKSLQGKMTDFARIEAKRQAEEAERLRREAEEKALEEAANMTPEEAEKMLDEAVTKSGAITTAAPSVRGSGDFGGTSHTASKLDIQIKDPAAVPVEFKSVDMDKVKAAVNVEKAKYTAEGTTTGLKGAALTNYVNNKIAKNFKIPGIELVADIGVVIR